MIDFEKITVYKKYLNTLQKILDEYFEEQKEYLCCKEGCSYCCEKGTYPYTKVEIDYILLGVLKLPKEEQEIIADRILKLKEEYLKCKENDKFMHKCPFLRDDGLCSVYEYRGIICRTFGILQITEKSNIYMPFCQSLGLNYAKVYDDEKRKFDMSKVKELGYKNYPIPHLVSMKTLISENVFEGENVDFGEPKAMMEWLSQ